MKRDLDYKIRVMTACKEGKKIRFKCNYSNFWEESCNELEFNWAELDYEIVPENPEYTYPMWFSNKYNKGFVVKFEGLQKGTVIAEGEIKWWSTGESFDDFISHTDSTAWIEIEEPKQKVTIEKWLVELNNTHIICETSNINSWIKEFAELEGTEIKKVRLIESYDIEI